MSVPGSVHQPSPGSTLAIWPDVEGIFNFTEQRPALAVVGGTREFRNARGQMFVLPGPTPEETRLVFALLL